MTLDQWQTYGYKPSLNSLPALLPVHLLRDLQIQEKHLQS